MTFNGLHHTKIIEYALYSTVQENIFNIENITNVVENLGDGVTPDLSAIKKRIDDLEKEAQDLRKILDDSIDIFGNLDGVID